MAAVNKPSSRNDRFDGSSDDDSTSPRNLQAGLSHLPRPVQHLDEAALLHLKQQYLNNGIQNNDDLVNPVDDLTQFSDPVLDSYDRDNNDMDDGEIHFDNGTNFDYEVSIQERLKKANEEFEHDDTPAKLEHKQRVSFDARVKAVDIVQDPQEYIANDDTTKPQITPVIEETSNDESKSRNKDNPHQYTVPLNDTQPREGPTLLENIKAVQFHGQPLIGRHQLHNPHAASASSNHDDNMKSKNFDTNKNSNSNENGNERSTTPSKNSMVVAINGEFEIQHEDDYTAKQRTKSSSSEDEDDVQKDSTESKTNKREPTPPTEAKPKDSLNPELNRLRLSDVRPKSSENGNRRIDSDDSSSNSFSNDNKFSSKDNQRPKSAIVLKSSEKKKLPHKYEKSYYDDLCRQAAEKRRTELQEERRKNEEAEKERKEKLAKAKETFEQWVRDKDAERKRINEEKRLEDDERKKREEENEKQIEELGRRKFQDWLERKDREAKLAMEYRKLQDEETAASGGSTSSINNHSRKENDRAFRRWLRRKYEQAREENRRIEIETRRLRRRQRRSIKRFQLHQDIQLAKSFGYS